MQDWVELLETSRTNLSHADIDSVTSTRASSGFVHSISNLILHKNKAQALLNLRVAAMHLNYIGQGKADYPDRTEILIKELASSPLTNVEVDRITEEMTSTTQRLRLPLHLALFISPLFLLVSSRIYNRDWDRKGLLLTSKALGNGKPESLRRVEKQLWKALFEMARGADTVSTIQSFFDSLSWDSFSGLPPHEKHWFQATQNLVIWGSPGLLDIHFEGELPLKWPIFAPTTGTAAPLLKRRAHDNDANPRLIKKTCLGGGLGEVRGASPQVGREREQDQEEQGGTSGQSIEEDVVDGVARPTDQERENGRAARGGEEGDGMDDQDEVDKRVEAAGGAGEEDSMNRDEVDKGVETAGGVEREDSMNRDVVDGTSQATGHEDGEDELSQPADEQDEEDPLMPPRRASRHKLSGSSIQKSTMRKSIAPKPKHPPARQSTRLARLELPSPAPEASALQKGSERKIARRNAPSRKVVKMALKDGDSLSQPIDLTVDDPTLDHLSTPEKYLGPSYCVFGPRGERFEIQPTSHCKAELEKLVGIFDAVKGGYVGGLPLHVSRPKDSIFAIYSNEEFAESSDRKILETLRGRHILVTGRDCPMIKFDLKSLRELRPLKRVDTVQDQSIDPGKNGNYNLRNVQGTLRQVFDCASLPDGKGKILNVLDCPMGDAVILKRNSFSSDLHAQWITKKLPDCGATEPLPGDDIRWGLAATSGASHWFHIDSDGFGTYIDVQTGGKLWIIARPKIKGGSHADFAKIDLLLSSNFDISEPGTEQWDLEAVFLEPGTRLIMRPNTPHAVYTHGHAICHGGHFYATSCLQDTLYSLIHSFVAGSVVTNTEHRASRLILRRMVQFYSHAHTNSLDDDPDDLEDHTYHMLSLDTSSGVLDLFAICILTEASTILSLQTYEDAGMSFKERKSCIEARYRSRVLLRWFFSRYELVRSGTVLDGYEEVYWRFLARVMKGLLQYKKRADGLQDSMVKGCNLTAVQEQVDQCFEGVKEYDSAIAYWDGKQIDSLAWPSDANHAFE
ncbi:hypothetical protein BD779DRAFT_1477708, partial [Infundibulicybe gibba]